MKRGLFITFEGTEGSGKSTLIRLISQQLQAVGFNPLVTREPGGTPLAEKLRALVLENKVDPKTELLIMEAARADHVTQLIRPALERGQIILCDRFVDSTLAYQSHGRGLPWNEVKKLNQVATSNLKPDLVIFLDIDPAQGLSRAKDPNRFEAEGVAFQKLVRKGFLKTRSEDPKRWITLRSDRNTPEELAAQVLKKLSLKIPSIPRTKSA